MYQYRKKFGMPQYIHKMNTEKTKGPCPTCIQLIKLAYLYFPCGSEVNTYMYIHYLQEKKK